jgi:Tfp pilus assembly protein FimT
MKILRSFSFIELLLIISIISILLASASPFYSRFVNQNNVTNISDQIVSNIHKAQSYAIASKNNSDWGINYSAPSLTLYRTSDNQVFDTFNVDSATTISGLTTLVFSKPTGLPSATPTITISASGNSRVITVNSQGVVDVQ